MDVSLYIVWRMPPRDVVDNSVKYTVVGRSYFPPPLAVVYLKIKSEGVPYICVVGATYCFESGRPDKTLLNFGVNDVDMDLDVSVNVTLNERTEGVERVVQLCLV